MKFILHVCLLMDRSVQYISFLFFSFLFAIGHGQIQNIYLAVQDSCIGEELAIVVLTGPSWLYILKVLDFFVCLFLNKMKERLVCYLNNSKNVKEPSNAITGK